MRITVEIKQNWLTLQKDKYFRWSYRISLTLFIIVLLLIIWQWSNLPPQLPLYYSLSWGDDQLAHPLALVLTFTLFIGVYLFNASLGFWLYFQNRYYARLLFVSNIFLTVLSLYTLIQIILLIT